MNSGNSRERYIRLYLIAGFIVVCIAGAIAVSKLKKTSQFPQVRSINVPDISSATSSLRAVTGAPSKGQKALTSFSTTDAGSRPLEHWYALLKSSPDRFSFVSKAARPAFDGDGRAAMYVGDAVMDCIAEIHQAAHGVDITAEHEREMEQLPLRGVPNWAAEVRTRHFERCRKLATSDAFTALPPRQGGYSDPRYWWDLAKESKDPGVLSRNAVERLSNPGSASDREVGVAEAQDAINKAVLSGDPMALFTMGFALSDGHLSTDTQHGMAIAMAACDLGYDCTWDNPAMKAEACKFNNSCLGTVDFPSYLRATLSPDKFATVYAQSRELETDLANQSTADILAFAKIYRAPPMNATQQRGL